MTEVRETLLFANWLSKLRDVRARARIAMRLDRLRDENMGDFKSIGDGVYELRIDYGPGYRVYFTWRRKTLVLLLCGGDKASQARDIARAVAMAKDFEKGAAHD